MQSKTLVVDDIPQSVEYPNALIYSAIGISLVLSLIAVLVKRRKKST
jgi:LPXTG-motif cell wall-anchored protein